MNNEAMIESKNGKIERNQANNWRGREKKNTEKDGIEEKGRKFFLNFCFRSFLSCFSIGKGIKLRKRATNECQINFKSTKFQCEIFFVNSIKK